jgi:excisionase family DNA binding protein
MFSVEVTFKVDGRSTTLDGFVQALFGEMQKAARTGNREALQFRKPPRPIPEVSWSPDLEPKQGTKRLALGLREAANMIGVCKRTLEGYVGAGDIRAIRIGRRVLIPIKSLEKVMREGLK